MHNQARERNYSCLESFHYFFPHKILNQQVVLFHSESLVVVLWLQEKKFREIVTSSNKFETELNNMSYLKNTMGLPIKGSRYCFLCLDTISWSRALDALSWVLMRISSGRRKIGESSAGGDFAEVINGRPVPHSSRWKRKKKIKCE